MSQAVFGGVHRRGILAAILALPIVALGPAPAAANQEGGNDRNEQRDTQSRNEQESLNHIQLRFGDGGLFDVKYVFLIQSRFVHVTDTFSKGIGVDFENLDRADVSDVPLLGSLFDKPLRGEDLTEENRVGSVYRGGDGTLVAVVDDAVNVADSEVSVVNGKGRYRISMKPELAEVDRAQLGELGDFVSVQNLVRGAAPRETSVVLSGLTTTSEPQVEGNVPLLKDIPGLRALLVGGMYEVEKAELVILVKPSIITGDEVED